MARLGLYGWDLCHVSCFCFDTEYDRAKVPPYNTSDPTSPLESWKPLCFQTYSNKHKGGYASCAHEVQHGTSSIHFHRAVPRSSSHTGPRLLFLELVSSRVVRYLICRVCGVLIVVVVLGSWLPLGLLFCCLLVAVCVLMLFGYFSVAWRSHTWALALPLVTKRGDLRKRAMESKNENNKTEEMKREWVRLLHAISLWLAKR